MKCINEIIKNIKEEFDSIDLKYLNGINISIKHNSKILIKCFENNYEFFDLFELSKNDKNFYIELFKFIFYASDKIWVYSMNGEIDNDYNFYTKRAILSFILLKSLLDMKNNNSIKIDDYIDNTKYINILKIKFINFYYYIYFDKKYLMKD